MPRSKNRHTRRAQKRRRKERRMGYERRLELSEERAGDTGIRMCGRKHKYASERAAVSAGLMKYGKVMRAYACPLCHGWHITSR